MLITSKTKQILNAIRSAGLVTAYAVGVSGDHKKIQRRFSIPVRWWWPEVGLPENEKVVVLSLSDAAPGFSLIYYNELEGAEIKNNTVLFSDKQLLLEFNDLQPYFIKNPPDPVGGEIFHPEALKMFKQNGWDSHPVFSRSEWQVEVVNNITQRGYWSWVSAQLEQRDEEKKSNSRASEG